MRTALLALLLSAAAALPAAAHTRLERSWPADGDTLRAAPAELRLLFSQPVATTYTQLVLRGPDGRPIDLPPLAPDSARRTFAAPVPALHVDGRYTVEWRTVAGDGHVITGTFAFWLAHLPNPDTAEAAPRSPHFADAGPGTAAAVPHVTDPLQDHHVDPARLPAYLEPGAAPGALARGLLFAGLLGIIGLAAFRALVLPRSGLPAEAAASLQPALRRFGLGALALLLVALPLRLWLQSAALHGPDRALDGALVGTMLLQLGWGRAWLLQLAAAAVALAGILGGRTLLVVLAAAALAPTPALQGHAAGVESLPGIALVADAGHVLAAGAWLGALATLVLAAIPALRLHSHPEYPQRLGQLVRRFSPLALGAVALLAASGLVSALFHLAEPADLYATEYGRMLLLKLFFVALVLGTGWYNWRRARPRLDAASGAAALYRAATLELLFAGAALAATAVLVGLPTP